MMERRYGEMMRSSACVHPLPCLIAVVWAPVGKFFFFVLFVLTNVLRFYTNYGVRLGKGKLAMRKTGPVDKFSPPFFFCTN